MDKIQLTRFFNLVLFPCTINGIGSPSNVKPWRSFLYSPKQDAEFDFGWGQLPCSWNSDPKRWEEQFALSEWFYPLPVPSSTPWLGEKRRGNVLDSFGMETKPGLAPWTSRWPSSRSRWCEPLTWSTQLWSWARGNSPDTLLKKQKQFNDTIWQRSFNINRN